MLPLRRRHWITIRQIQGNFYNLDSKLESPQLIGRVIIINNNLQSLTFWDNIIKISVFIKLIILFTNCICLILHVIFPSLQSSDLIAYLKEQLDSKEKELFVVVSKEVEEKQLWMHQYTMEGNKQSAQNTGQPQADGQCDSPVDSISSLSQYDYRNRDAECLKLTEVSNCVGSAEINY